MSNDSVTNQHTAYAAQQTKRDVFAAISSTDAIREKQTTYLPQYPAEDNNEYLARLNSATIDGITSSGVDVLTGAVFFDEIDTSKVNPQIAPLLENIDNKGNSFNVFARDSFNASFDGFSVILVDMPKAEMPVVSLDDEKRMGMRPYWRLYDAKDVWNWRYRIDPMTKQTQLEMLVLREVTCEPDGRFADKEVTRYRVLWLDGMSVKWEVWKQSDPKAGANAGQVELDDPGGTLATTEPKLLVESRLEIKAYQKESSFDVIEYLSIPVFWTKGYPSDGPKLGLGAGTHVRLPADQFVDLGYIQIDAAGHESLKGTIANIKTYIRSRVNEMVDIAVEQGADGGGEADTATEAVIKDRDKQARLIVWADELKDALERALQYTAEFMGLGSDKGGEIVLRTKWVVSEEKRQEAAEMQAKTDEANIAATKAKAAPPVGGH
jgi:hypothetical protein